MSEKTTPQSAAARKDWIQIDALCCGTGWNEADLSCPQILIEDVFGESHPGSIHLDGFPGRRPPAFTSVGEDRPGFMEPISVTVGPCCTAG